MKPNTVLAEDNSKRPYALCRQKILEIRLRMEYYPHPQVQYMGEGGIKCFTHVRKLFIVRCEMNLVKVFSDIKIFLDTFSSVN